ncbi:MAG TPA: DNA polymerase Y family protein [Marinobacter hydrocarbonoclasticus]|jgi:protein ImuB|uniref:DNA polymerase Y family protein n=1 Tax=Marinobacter nauticus TaxID=2743 RepID=A0A350S0C3_MARNT|nr:MULTISPECIES: DNA polymerase Y family protein [Marinobacter]ERS87859.1 DNA repair protein [Marinobacter sp. EVN1]MAC21199.1 DNA repair protein [Marinobacter sp.]MBW3199424.1 DNA polymerase Y family protein [Marinobacter nauticus]MBY6184840.1 DNA polymerase Y family protein [Marinobacter nauticus]HAC28706.1 DNA polymerase Y family protein [Marinobacter nauticus]|tara:strand:+ start:1791 stop:3212 length:1422 start_codon:yes stop_codon:yes gene_type:complete
MLWLYLHFPHLLLDHVRRSQQTQGALAVVDLAGQAILQVCPEADHLGIRPGMRLKTALGLAPDLVILHLDSQQEANLLEEQARWLYRYAAHITLSPPHGLWAEVSSLQRLYGGLPAVWQTVEQALAERQLTAWLALGHTPLAAQLLAQAGKGECTADKGHILTALGKLPLVAAGFDEKSCTRLHRLGLNTLAEVFNLPARELARRLSPELLARIQKAQGTRPDPKSPWHPPHRFRQRADFIQEVEHAQGLLFALQRILTELEEDLCWRQQDTDTLHLLLQHRHEEATRLTLRTTGPEHRAESFLKLLRLKLDQHPLRAPVISLSLSVKRFLGREAPVGQDLLGDGQDLNEAWHTLASRLQARLGTEALQQLAPRADHRPEFAWTASAIKPASRHSETPEVSGLPARPLWLLSTPHPLAEPPARWFSGPERISAGWWDGQRVHRDYYIAQLSSGQLAWVFRDIRDGWYIHGWFG